MTPNFISTYYPDLADIDSSTYRAARSRIETHLRRQFPDLDTKPNSVFGDLVLTPFAYMLAAHEEAMGRFMSDLDLENVAAGVIYNCDFVSKYLNNFAIVDRDNLFSTGIIRLTFCADSTYTIDRRTRFLFGTDNEFTLRLPYDGHLEIKPTGAVLPANQNTRVLVQVDENLYACTFPVTGAMDGAVILRGAAATVDTTITDLDSIEAAVNFERGVPTDSLPKLAERTRKTFYDATLSTRSGAKRFLFKEFPELVAVSPVLTGDDEQLRDIATSLGVPQGRVDIYVKSTSFNTVETQTITCTLNVSDNAFRAKVAFLEPPYRIDSIYVGGDTTTNLVDTIELIARGTNDSKAPLATNAYSTHRDYWISIPNDSFSTTVITGGNQIANFTINYRTDPAIQAVADVVDAPNHKPVGVDILTRGFVVTDLTSLTITYVRKPGIKPALGTARAAIYNYFKDLGYDHTYTDSHIIKCMYDAGVESVVSIVPVGAVRMEIANYIMEEGDLPADPLTDWTTAKSNARTVPNIAVSTTTQLVPDYQDPNILNASTVTYASAGKRNIAYLLDADQIIFTETTA